LLTVYALSLVGFLLSSLSLILVIRTSIGLRRLTKFVRSANLRQIGLTRSLKMHVEGSKDALSLQQYLGELLKSSDPTFR